MYPKLVYVFAGLFSSTKCLRLGRKLIPISKRSKPKWNNLMTVESPKRILVFGDSNSWGWTPRNDQEPTFRLAKNVRWPGVLADKLGPGSEIIEEALSARTTNLDDPEEDLPSEHLRAATLKGATLL